MSRLIIFDTSNFTDWPVGGQLTSISNFLRYLQETCPHRKDDVLLVGVTPENEDASVEGASLGDTYPSEEAVTPGGSSATGWNSAPGGSSASGVGKLPGHIVEGPFGFPFLPVISVPTDQSGIHRSVRLEYLKGLIRNKKLLKIRDDDCCYIHTPEAYAGIRCINRKAACYVFSHGTYGDMWRRVRFFKKLPPVRLLFQWYLMQVIRGAKAVFILDRDSLRDYRGKARKLVRVRNSAVRDPKPPEKQVSDPVRCLYAGRLSKVKNIGPIIEAFSQGDWAKGRTLTIAGAGEEEKTLKAMAGDRVSFTGALSPEDTRDLMRRSDILVMNSVFEGMPMAIIEAMSSGLPVVTTDTGGIGDNLVFGKGCEKTDGTVQGIRNAVDRILSDYGRYSGEAFEYSEVFDYRRVNRKVFGELNKTLGWQENQAHYDKDETGS
ncbi:MAG: glycosyltransferase family 4 protein [Lachnospiraceae bacterium]|nr:glycosyltransferase family 4 protein [Lachnospiraceae bacterium]